MWILGFAVLAVFVCASPHDPGVKLLASWHKPPFELSVIQSLSTENSSAYYPLLDVFDEIRTDSDKSNYDSLFAYAIQNGFISPQQKPFIDLKLALHEPSAVIQAYYQYFETAVLPQLSNMSCDNVLFHDGNYYCDPDVLFDIEPKPTTIDFLPDDRTSGDNEDAPIVVLYADMLSKGFKPMHQKLRELSLSGAIRYIARYKPSEQIHNEKESLAGYGIAVTVLDGLKWPAYEVEKDATEYDAWKNSMASLGYKAARFITNARSGNFDQLRECSLYFPDVISAISMLDPGTEILEEVKANVAADRYHPGSNFLLVNGAPEDSIELGLFSVTKAIDRERMLVEDLSSEFGISLTKAGELISSNLVGKAKKRQGLIRYDYRTQGIIWLNDLELDEAYDDLSDDWSVIFDHDIPGELFPVRYNSNTAVLALDLTNEFHLMLYLQMEYILRSGMAIQMGIIPLTHTPEAAKLAKGLHLAVQRGTRKSAAAYMANILQQKVSEHDPVSSSESTAINAIIENTNAWMKRLAIDGHAPVIYANGISIPVSNNEPWLSGAREVWLSDKESLRRLVQDKSIMEEHSSPLREHLLDDSLTHRSALITPAEENFSQYVDTSWFVNEVSDMIIPNITNVNEFNLNNATTWWYFGDFDDRSTAKQVIELMTFMRSTDKPIQLNVLPILNGTSASESVFESVEILDDFSEDVHEKAFVRYLRSILENYARDQLTHPHAQQAVLSDSKDYKLSRAWSQKLQGLFKTHSTRYLVAGGRLLIPEEVLGAADLQYLYTLESARVNMILQSFPESGAQLSILNLDKFVSKYTKTYYRDETEIGLVNLERQSQLHRNVRRATTDDWIGNVSSIAYGDSSTTIINITAAIDPLSEKGQFYVSLLSVLGNIEGIAIKIYLAPKDDLKEVPLKGYYGYNLNSSPQFDARGALKRDVLSLELSTREEVSVKLRTVPSWQTILRKPIRGAEKIVGTKLHLKDISYELQGIDIEGHNNEQLSYKGTIELRKLDNITVAETNTIGLSGYFQLRANPGFWQITSKGEGGGAIELNGSDENKIWISSLSMPVISAQQRDMSRSEVANDQSTTTADINIVTMAYEGRENAMIQMMVSVLKSTSSRVKFWIADDNINPGIRDLLPTMAELYGFEYSMIKYSWPRWMWIPASNSGPLSGVMFWDAIVPKTIGKVIWLSPFSLVRADLKELVDMDLGGAPYAMALTGESGTESDPFWKSGYWQTEVLKNGKYKFHSPDMVLVDMPKFREYNCGEIIRTHYQLLSVRHDRVDQRLMPNMLQDSMPIQSLDSGWYWQQMFDSEESMEEAKIINLGNGKLKVSQIPGLSEIQREVKGLRANQRRYHDDL